MTTGYVHHASTQAWLKLNTAEPGHRYGGLDNAQSILALVNERLVVLHNFSSETCNIAFNGLAAMWGAASQIVCC